MDARRTDLRKRERTTIKLSDSLLKSPEKKNVATLRIFVSNKTAFDTCKKFSREIQI